MPSKRRSPPWRNLPEPRYDNCRCCAQPGRQSLPRRRLVQNRRAFELPACKTILATSTLVTVFRILRVISSGHRIDFFLMRTKGLRTLRPDVRRRIISVRGSTRAIGANRGAKRRRSGRPHDRYRRTIACRLVLQLDKERQGSIAQLRLICPCQRVAGCIGSNGRACRGLVRRR